MQRYCLETSFVVDFLRIASEIELDLKEKGRSVNLVDALIAATAIEK